jgi:hypothetical protein
MPSAKIDVSYVPKTVVRPADQNVAYGTERSMADSILGPMYTHRHPPKFLHPLTKSLSYGLDARRGPT